MRAVSSSDHEEPRWQAGVRGYAAARMFLSPMLIGLTLGGLCLLSAHPIGYVAASLLTLGGAAVGVRWARDAMRTADPARYLSGVSGTPALARAELLEQLRGEEPAQILAAISGFEQLGRVPEAALPELERLSSHADERVAAGASDALARALERE